jgi:putative ABC transport system permease protein
MGFVRRLMNVLRPAHLDRDFDEELEFHRQMRLRKAREQGLSPAEALQETKRRMGNLPLAKEEMRDARTVGWLASSLQDVRHGIVLLRRDARISALVVLILALGIGGNTAIFTLMEAAFLDPLPYRDAGRLVTIMENDGWLPSVSEFLQIRARTRTLELMAFAEHLDMQVSGSGVPVRVFGARVTASFFPLLGVSAWRGRTFIEEDNEPGRSPTVILTYAFWRTKLAADPAVLGRTLRLDGKPAVVVGVLPPAFHFDYPTLRIPEAADLYVSFPIDHGHAVWPSSSGHDRSVRVLARLREGAREAEAEAELRRVGQALVHEYPKGYTNNDGGPSRFTFELTPLRDAIVGTQRSLLWLFLGSVTTLLLIACANTAQLLLTRSVRREREVAVRVAVGASQLRLIRQFLLEGLVLATCAGTAGLLVSVAVARLLISVLPMRNPLLASARWDVRSIGFTLAISLISAIVFAVVPAVKGSRWTSGVALGGHATTEGNLWRYAMIAVEGVLSVFLLCGAGIVAQNLWVLISTPTGFDPKHVLAMRLTYWQQEDGRNDSGLRRCLEKIAAIPGVDSAATVTGPPLRSAGVSNSGVVSIADGTGAVKKIIGIGDTHRVSPDYFRTLRIPLLSGRTFHDYDDSQHPLVAVVNQEFERRFGLSGDVLRTQWFGERLSITIVGMVGDVRTSGLQSTPVPEVYLSSLQIDGPDLYLLVRSALPTTQLVKLVKAAIQSTSPEQAVFGVLTMDQLIADSLTVPRFNVFLVATFALLAVAMAAIGMYSLVACLVSQRTREIAIRMALGASYSDIVRSVLGTTAAWVALGLAGGLGLGFVTRSIVRSLSSSIVEGSPWMYVSVVLFFGAVTLVAAYVPVRRASRLDPATALRAE